MKYNFTKALHKQDTLSHIILHSTTKPLQDEDLVEYFTNQRDGAGDIIIELKLTANGKEMNLESFINQWQGQVNRIITDKAKELVDTSMSDIQELLDDLQGRLTEEVNKRLEDWELK